MRDSLVAAGCIRRCLLADEAPAPEPRISNAGRGSGSAGEIGRPETVPIDHLVVIFLEK